VRVDIDGESVELVTFVAVAKGDDDSGACDRTYGDGIWKIPLDKDVSLLPGLNFAFSDLLGSSLAQTTGAGASARITFDTDAAGHGWYIDYTPCLNEEYLSTSNPHEWMAIPYAVLMPAVLFGEALQWPCLYRR
jgi:hypothetical protein